MSDSELKDFEGTIRSFLKTYGFLDIGGGNKFKIGGVQVDACGGVDDYLVIIDTKTTKSNVLRKITEMRGKLSQFKTFNAEDEGEEFELYRKYKQIILVIATKSPMEENYHEKGSSVDPIVHIWDKQFFDYYKELNKLIKGYSKFQLYGELKIGYDKLQTTNFAAMRLPSRNFNNIYSFVASPKNLLELCYVARRESGDEKHYQRLINKNKLDKIATYIRKGKSFANNIIVAIPKDISQNVSFKKAYDLNGIEFGELTIPKTYRSLWIIDGQHRLYGYSGLKGELSPNDLLQVAAIENVSVEEQRELFIKINKEQSPVQMDLLWDLYSIAEPENPKTGVLSRVAKYLDTLPQFQKKIYYPLRSAKKTREQISISKICNAIYDARLIKGTLEGYKQNPLYDKDFDKMIKKVAKGINEFYELLERDFTLEPQCSAFYSRVCLNGAGIYIMLSLYSRILSVQNKPTQSIDDVFRQYVSLLHEFVSENFSEKKQIDAFQRSSNSKTGKAEHTDSLCEGINLKISAKGLTIEKLPVSRKAEENRVLGIEKNLRDVINTTLRAVDENWEKNRTPPDLYQKLIQRAKGDNIPLSTLLTLGESIDIVLRNDNLPLFNDRIKVSFFTQNLFKAETDILKEYRNTVPGHDRMMSKEKESRFRSLIPGILKRMGDFLEINGSL
ncbi:MAG: DGQHR domain-containing protein [Candidatus Thermoplasmatota archaeon]|nr:DGQHR domain-containing protein [Candidatus Thermoplasmatota archaeon]